MTVDLGRYGVWRPWQRLSPQLATELEQLGFGTIWVGSSPPGDLAVVEQYLAATSRIVVATSVVNMWADSAPDVARAYHRLAERYPGRFLLGVGIGHPEQSTDYRRPYDTMVDYLDALDDAGVPPEGRVLAALGPKALRLAGERTRGAIPYLVTPEHTRRARVILGPDVLLAPEQKVVVDADPQRGRDIGRPYVHRPYLGLSNYLRSLRELGYTDADLAGTGSDRLIDDLVAHGAPAEIAARLDEHVASGADHVAIQLLTAPDADPLPGYEALAEALLR
jgi:probable F420-dependent oxidoreductase